MEHQYFTLKTLGFKNYIQFRTKYPHKYAVKHEKNWNKLFNISPDYFLLIPHINSYEYIYPETRNTISLTKYYKFETEHIINVINNKIINLIFYKFYTN